MLDVGYVRYVSMTRRWGNRLFVVGERGDVGIQDLECVSDGR